MNFVIRLLKDWTLPVAMFIGGSAYLLFAFTPALSSAAGYFDRFFDFIYPLFMFFILFVTFCKVDLHRLRLMKWHFWISLGQLLGVLLIIGFILGCSFSGEALILSEGLLTCIIAPTASAAAVVTSKLGGDLETMTTYTFISNMLVALYVPTFFPLIHPVADVHFFAAFSYIFGRVCTVLVIPMLLAVFVRKKMPRFHQKIVSVRDLSFYIWACSLSIVTGTTVKHIVHSDVSTFFLLLLAVGSLFVCLIQFGVGRKVGARYGTAIDTGQAFGQKNTAFAIWIAYSYLTPVSSVGPGCYILWQNIINSIELWQQKRAGQLTVS